jgi:hypothetical protein
MMVVIIFLISLSLLLTGLGIYVLINDGFNLGKLIITLGFFCSTIYLSFALYKSFDYEYEITKETYVSNKIPEINIKTKIPTKVTLYKKKCPKWWACTRNEYIYKVEFDNYVWEGIN